MPGFLHLLAKFRRDDSGAFAIIFALMAIVLVALGGAVVDYVSMEQARNRAQIALDATALALQPEIHKAGVTEDTIKVLAQALVDERIGNDAVVATVTDVRIDLERGALFLGGDFTIPTNFVRLVGVNEMGARYEAEAVRGSLDIEMAVALDLTISMQGQAIVDLKAAMTDLIDTIVPDQQPLNYTKMALVPYSQAVNLGTYAEALRGPIRGANGITGAAWSSGSSKSVSGATKARTAVITANGHGFANGDWVYISGVRGMTNLNSNAYQVANKTNNTFELSGVDSRNYDNYNSGGSVIKCQFANCNVQITSGGHSFPTGQYVYVTDVSGMTGLNGKLWELGTVAPNTFIVLNSASAGASGTYTSNTGRAWCTWQTTAQGCSYYRFINPAGNVRLSAVTTCATERANATSDLAPSSAFVGRSYPGNTGNACLPNAIVPLTSDKSVLHAAVNNFSVAGSTAGELGIVWAWHMLSPSFASVWPAGRQPDAYLRRNLLKTAILMTDGDFNTVHCNGVIANNSTYGSGGAYDYINCPAPNGDAYTQAKAYCDAMKAKGILVFTVGFNINEGSGADQLLEYCADRKEYAFLATGGTQLRETFQQIARNISALRLTQ